MPAVAGSLPNYCVMKVRLFHVGVMGPMSGCFAEWLVRGMRSFEIQRNIYTASLLVWAAVFVTSNDKASAKRWRFHRGPNMVECWRMHLVSC